MNFSCCEKFIGSADKSAYLHCMARVSYPRQRSGKVPLRHLKKRIKARSLILFLLCQVCLNMNFSCCEKFIGSADKSAYLHCMAQISYPRQRSGKVPPSGKLTPKLILCYKYNGS